MRHEALAILILDLIGEEMQHQPFVNVALAVDRAYPGAYRWWWAVMFWALHGVTFTPTSYWRTPEQNAAVGGSPASQHLVGLALDLVPARGPTWDEAARRLTRAGMVVVDEGDHVHIQATPAGTLPVSELLAKA